MLPICGLFSAWGIRKKKTTADYQEGFVDFAMRCICHTSFSFKTIMLDFVYYNRKKLFDPNTKYM
jgi:hypothetical protein